MNCDDLQQMTALKALGALTGDDLGALNARLAEDEGARRELARFLDVATELAAVVARRQPPVALRAKILEQIRRTPQLKPEGSSVLPPFHFVDRDAPWMPTPIPGVRLKVLSASPSAEYAMLLAELAPGTVYPEHEHEGVEETYVLTGDLTCQGRVLKPGDYFHAEPGTHHEPLTSQEGCTAIFVVPRKAFLEFAAQR